MMEIALLGQMGRDEALAARLQAHKLHIIGTIENPGLIDKAEQSGGQFYKIDTITNVAQITECVEHIQPDMFLTNFDDSLAAGVVDALKQRIANKEIGDMYIPCPDRNAARIEWDKFYLRELVDEIAPQYNPLNFMVKDASGIHAAIDYFENQDTPIAIKPRGLTGGKGVKVMGKHFDTFHEGSEYALRVIAGNKQTGVEIQEKLEGHEFTLQLLTDGKTLIKPPATYDYPYREDNDTGPGTGGMGAFSMEDGLLPFITEADYTEAVALMYELLGKLQEQGQDYKGVLYPTFFKTSEGLKIVETNARGGDPELINIIDLMEDNVDLAEMFRTIATGELAQDKVRYKALGSAIVYLVSPDYGYRKGPSYSFTLDTDRIESLGCNVRFAAAEKVGSNQYQTVGSSRTVGISALGKTAWQAGNKIRQAITDGFQDPISLEYRLEIAEKTYIENLLI